MKHVVGFFFTAVVMVLMMTANEYILKNPIPEFFIGWFSYFVFTASRNFYENRFK